MPGTAPTILLSALFDRLRQAGFAMSVANILDIERLLLAQNLLDTEGDEPRLKLNVDRLPYLIAPVIARNRNEQDVAINVIAEYIKQCKLIALDPPDPAYTTRTDSVIDTPEVSNDKKRTYRAVQIITGIAVLAIIGYIFFAPGKPKSYKVAIDKAAKNYSIGDSEVFRASLIPAIDKSDSLEWRIGQKIFITKDTFLPYLFDEECVDDSITVCIKNRKVQGRDSRRLGVACRHIDIKLLGSEPNMKGDTGTFIPACNDTTNTHLFTWTWRLNDSLISKGKNLTWQFNKPGSNELRLTAHTHGICNADSISATYTLNIDSIARLKLTATSNGLGHSEFWIASGKWTLLISLLVLAFIIDITYIFFAPKILRKRRPGAPGPAITEDYDNAPYELQFRKKDHLIHEDEHIDALAHQMRIKHNSGWRQLNINKTVTQTSANAGFPIIVYEDRVKPRNYIILVDQKNEHSQTAHLFNWLIRLLQKMDVHIEQYVYNGLPLRLRNESGAVVSLQKLTDDKSDHNLILFGDCEKFFRISETTLDPRLAAHLTNWPVKSVVTPKPVADWSYPEAQLKRTGFIVVPAEIEAITLMTRTIGDDESSKRDKLVAMLTERYTTPSVDFENIEELRAYLGDDEALFQWLCALAVYPRLTWELTLTLGKAIANAMNLRGGGKEVVLDFDTLLRLSRISWLNEGFIADDLRLQLLQQIDKDTHLLARQQIIAVCEEMKANLPERSMALKEYEIQHTINAFFLYANDPRQFSKHKEAAEKMESLWEHIMDWPLQTLTNTGKNNLMPDGIGVQPYKTVDEYFTDLASLSNPTIVGWLIFALLLIATFFIVKDNTLLKRWSKTNYQVSLNIPHAYCSKDLHDTVYMQLSSQNGKTDTIIGPNRQLPFTIADKDTLNTITLFNRTFSASALVPLTDTSYDIKLPDCAKTKTDTPQTQATPNSLLYQELSKKSSRLDMSKIKDLILKKGADPKTSGKDGWTALHECARQNDLPFAKKLLAMHVPINTKNFNNATPLLTAAFFKSNDIYNLLNGIDSVDRKARSFKNGKTAADYFRSIDTTDKNGINGTKSSISSPALASQKTDPKNRVYLGEGLYTVKDSLRRLLEIKLSALNKTFQILVKRRNATNYQEAINFGMLLFDNNENVIVQVASKNRTGIRSYKIRTYLTKIAALSYEKIEITSSDIVFISDLVKGADGKLHGSAVVMQNFTEKMDDDTATYQDKIKKSIQFTVPIEDEEIDGIQRKSFTIFLGNISVLEIPAK